MNYNAEKSKEKRRLYWNCKCLYCNSDKLIPVSASNLKSGHTQSCGCIKRSHGEIKIEEILKSNNINFETQKSFKDLIGTTRPLRFDFYLPDYNICIEYQGIQHYEEIEAFGGKDAFLKTKNFDEKKRQYCKVNNIKLIEIPYYDFKLITENYLLTLFKL